jgi:hypothetical protein
MEVIRHQGIGIKLEGVFLVVVLKARNEFARVPLIKENRLLLVSS